MRWKRFQPKFYIAQGVSRSNWQIEVMSKFGKSCFICAIWWEVIGALEEISMKFYVALVGKVSVDQIGK